MAKPNAVLKMVPIESFSITSKWSKQRYGVFTKLMYKDRIGKHKDFNKVIYYVGMQSVIIIEGHDKFDGVWPHAMTRELCTNVYISSPSTYFSKHVTSSTNDKVSFQKDKNMKSEHFP